MKLVSVLKNIKYLSDEGVINVFHLDDFKIPQNIDLNLISSVFSFNLDDNENVLVIKNKKEHRNLEIPGGHVELGESPDSALFRECLEEACVEVFDSKPIVLYEILDPKQTKYPIKSYQLFYVSKIKKMNPFIENEEIQERMFLNKNEFSQISWAQEHPGLIKMLLEYME